MNTYITPSPYGTPYTSLRPLEDTKKRGQNLAETVEKTYPYSPHTNTLLARYCSPAPTQSSQASSEIRTAQEYIQDTEAMLNQFVSLSTWMPAGSDLDFDRPHAHWRIPTDAD